MNPSRERPTLSVVIPTHNADRWIAETLDSIFAQTELPGEIVVVDDASTDGTADRVSAVATGAPVPIHLIRRTANSGSPALPLNAGVARATGDLIAVLDQDDVFLPSKLERQARVLAADPEISLVFSLFGTYGAPNPGRDLTLAWSRVRHIHSRMEPREGYFRCDGPVALEEFARSINYVGGFPGFLFRRRAWELKGGFDERFVVATDYDFLCWLCTQGAVAFVPEVHYHRREHDRNLTFSSGIQWRIDAVNVMMTYLDFDGAPNISTVIHGSIGRLLHKVAMRLDSAGHREAAAEVWAALDRLHGAGWRRLVRRLESRLYAAYFKIRRAPWKIAREESYEAADQARRLAQLLV